MAGRRSPRRVSALVAVHNAAEFLAATLDSLATQTHSDLEILISDDASTDATLEMCRHFAADDPRTRVIAQPERLGWVGNVNALYAAATGDLVFLLSHDDTIRAQYVSRLEAALRRDPDATVAFSDVEVTRRNGSVDLISYRDLEDVDDPIERGRRILRGRGPWWVPYRGLTRRAALARTGGLQRHAGGEVWAEWRRVLHLALLGPMLRVPHPLYLKQVRSEGVSGSWEATYRRRLAALLSCREAIRDADLAAADRMRLYRTLGARSLTLRRSRRPRSG